MNSELEILKAQFEVCFFSSQRHLNVRIVINKFELHMGIVRRVRA